MKPFVMIGFFAFFLASTAARSVVCPIERAHYRYTAPKGWNITGTADFVKPLHPIPMKKGAVALHVQFSHDGRAGNPIFDGWFLFNQGNGPVISLIETTDPNALPWTSPLELGAPPGKFPYQEFYSWNEDHDIIESAPYISTYAPKYFFIPDLATAIAQKNEIRMPHSMFKFDHCNTTISPRTDPSGN